MILSTIRARIIFGFAVLLAASAGLGVLSSQWDLDSSEKQEFPAMRAPMREMLQQQKAPAQHDSIPSHDTAQESGKTGSA